MTKSPLKSIGVLALQGDYEAHEKQLKAVGAKPVEVRLPKDLKGLDALILPGGESTTMNKLIDRFGLRPALIEFCKSKPVWGTCAGMIMLSKKIEDNKSNVMPFGLLDIDVERNGYGRQVFSFEDSVDVSFGNGTSKLAATFIRAPKVTRIGKDVKVLGKFKNDPVLIVQKNILASSFHTELEEDTTLLSYFLTSFLNG